MVAFESFFVTTLPFFFYDRMNPFVLFLRPITNLRVLFWARVQRVFVCLCLAYVIFGQLMQIYLGYMQNGNMVVVTESLAWVIIGMICLDVCWTICARTGPILHIIKHLKSIYPQDKDVLERIDAKKVLDPLTRIFTYFQSIYVFTLVFKVGLPLWPLLQNYWADEKLTFEMPLRVWYPFNAYNPLWVAFVYLFEGWGTFLSTCPMIVITSLIGGITSALCVQFKLLAFEFGAFKSRGREFYAEDSQRLKTLVERHCALIELGEEIKDIFSSFLLGNYVFCSIGMSLFMFVSATSENRDVIIEFAGNVICFVLYISTLSLFGHRYIEHVSGATGTCTWDSQEVIIKLISSSLLLPTEHQHFESHLRWTLVGFGS